MTPGQMADKVIELAQESSVAGEELVEIELVKPLILIEIRKNHASDKSAEREWATTDFGQKEIKLRSRIKINTSLISAFKTKIRVANNEAFNMQ